jgi:hypothetical protein
MDLSSPFLFYIGRNKGYLGESTQELWICFLSHAYDRESDNSHIPLREEAPPLADQE